MAAFIPLNVQRGSAGGGLNYVIVGTVTLLMINQCLMKPACEPGKYYDNVTERCDYCSDICEQAKVMDTVEDCELHCPGFLAANIQKEKRCPSQQYYDDKVERCQSCDSLCMHAKIRGSELECKKLCPDWSATIEKQINSTHRNTSTFDVGLAQSPLFHLNPTNILVVIAVLFGFFVIASIGIVIIIRHIQGRKCTKKGVQVVQGESLELCQHLTGGGDIVTHPEEEPNPDMT